MADPRFYNRLALLTLDEIAALTGAAISDSGTADLVVEGVGPLNSAIKGQLSYAESDKALKSISDQSLQGVIIFAPLALCEVLRQKGGIALSHPAPRSGFSKALAALYAIKAFDQKEAVHTQACVSPSAMLSPGVVIGEGVELGEGVIIGPSTAIGPGCKIGAHSRIGANVTMMCTDIGENCNILSGAVIGESGFGIAVSSDGLIDVPHLGGVVLGNNVTIGANTTIDRGVFGQTCFGDDCKVDNLCHIAHNVTVGTNLVMAGFSGISGSTTLEDGVMFGGRVGLSDHIHIGKGATIGSNAAVMSDVPAGETYAGAPAQPIRNHMREIAELRRLVRNKTKSKKKS